VWQVWISVSRARRLRRIVGRWVKGRGFVLVEVVGGGLVGGAGGGERRRSQEQCDARSGRTKRPEDRTMFRRVASLLAARVCVLA